MRDATPLEEFRRSWTRAPLGVDTYFHQKKLDQFKDPDGDEAQVQVLIDAKKAKRTLLKESMAAK